MKKTILLPVLMTVLLAGISQAVTVHWAVTTFPSGVGGVNWTDITQAALVFTVDGLPSSSPSYSGGLLSDGSQVVGDVVEGMAITPDGIGAMTTFDAADRSATEGSYYVVLFYTSGSTTYYATSTTGLLWNSPTSITTDPMAPATESFDPVGFSSFTPVPEPSTGALLFAGLAAVMMRRRRNVA